MYRFSSCPFIRDQVTMFAFLLISLSLFFLSWDMTISLLEVKVDYSSRPGEYEVAHEKDEDKERARQQIESK